MTFLLPYSLIKRKWSKVHRQLSRFDLVLALFLPFSVATALLVISSASAFHAKDTDVLNADGQPVPSLAAGYYKILDQRLAFDGTLPEDPIAAKAMADTLPESERRLAASLTNRDAKQLANTLAPIMGDRVANLIFGIGILAMALSTMMVHMLMNGFAISQAVGRPGASKPFIIGAAMPALLAIFAPLAWSGGSKTALLIPAAVIATVFLPIAYLSILLLMNSSSVLKKEDRATPVTNCLMITAAGIATFASVWLLWNKGTAGIIGIVGLSLLAIIGIAGFYKNSRQTNAV
jgi:Mn2+/Fe2+ NRAMP family transporter